MMNPKNKLIQQIEINKLVDFKSSPFHVRNDEAMQQLISSIRKQGVMVPLIVNQINDSYMILSGHRRKSACAILGITQAPAIVYDNIGYDESVIIMVDSNLGQRDCILISERAQAYLLKLKALHNLTNAQKSCTSNNGGFSAREILADMTDIGGRQIQRYIRLTYLIPELMHMVDVYNLAIRPAYELSFLTYQQQEDIVDAITEIQADSTRDVEPNITHAQARILRRMAEEDNLDVDRVIKVLSTPKPNQKDKLHISLEDIGPYMPRGYTDAQCRQYLVELARREYERKQKSEKVKKELGL